MTSTPAPLVPPVRWLVTVVGFVRRSRWSGALYALLVMFAAVLLLIRTISVTSGISDRRHDQWEQDCRDAGPGFHVAEFRSSADLCLSSNDRVVSRW